MLIRVDASPEIGFGHLMRCLTLAEALNKRGHTCLFATKAHSNNGDALIKRRGFDLISLPLSSNREVNLQHSTWLGSTQEEDYESLFCSNVTDKYDLLVVDHYGIDQSWLVLARKHASLILVIDDLGDRAIPCDILIDQNLGVNDAKYVGKLSPNTLRCFGPTYALLREEFHERRVNQPAYENCGRDNICISMGGSDPGNYTMRICKEISAFVEISGCEVTVVLGNGYRYLDDFCSVFSRNPNFKILYSIENMAEIYGNADVIVGAGGASSWERCCVERPSIVFAVAENQLGIVESLHSQGVALHCRDLSNIVTLLADRSWRAGVAKKASKLVDGLGVERVISVIEDKIGELATLGGVNDAFS